jgi:DNA helicase-2/ATP-dependent DNA helicase PcrA
LIVDLGQRDEPGEVNLTSERYDVRQAAKRSTFTGKTYNSVDNISQFFGDRGIPFNAANKPVTAPQQPPAPMAPQLPRPPLPAKPVPPAAPPVRRGARAGMTVEHPKYGTGTVVRREGDGDDAKITVNFPRYGLKKLVEKYAGLKRN